MLCKTSYVEDFCTSVQLYVLPVIRDFTDFDTMKYVARFATGYNTQSAIVFGLHV